MEGAPLPDARCAGPSHACPNCGAAAPERYCPACGQAQRPLRVPFRRVVAEALDETLSLDGRLARTLPALFLRPGEASRAWREGKRASHTSPTKLYLLASFAFFFALAIGPDFALRLGAREASVGPAGARRGPVQTDPAELEALRAAGGFQATLADHLERLQRLPPEEAQRQVNAALVDNAAKAMFVAVPLAALALLLLHARRGFFYTEHLTFALHAQSVTFALLLPGLASGRGGLTGLGVLASGAHLLLAMRRFYGTGWVGTVLRWLALSFVYLLLVGLTVAAAGIVAILTS